ncbi:type II/IV secretion system protein [Candidatus Saccharibacteria bacterium]|nr:type II/IV secretion system protein [Candidatus Saccharibacteria bacterium]
MSVLSAEAQKQVEEKLVADKLVSATELANIKKKAEADNKPFMSLLVADSKLSNEQLTRTIAKVTNVPYVNLTNAQIDQDILTLLPKDIAERYMAVPLGEMQRRLVVAMLDAGNVQAVDFLANKIGRPLKVYAASEEGIRSVIKQYEGASLGKEMEAALGAQQQQDRQEQEEEKASKPKVKQNTKIQTIVQDSPISKALSTILDYAAKNRASDIHIEPLEHELKIRCRIDGVLREIMKLPKSTEPPLVSRIKILANLKIDEHRIPQDGQFTIQSDDKAIDLRIAISPVVWGEQVVIRLLDKSGTTLKLEDMGYKGRALRAIREGVKSSNGMVLTSGPTGSGKSTSMYALIQEIMSDGINIVTLEDPVEYKVGGVNQIQVNADVGLTFAAGLRSILRQDPDVVMVGEIRDKETAQLAVQAALTGHLVFSTLHTNSAAGILPRLLDMGIEPFLIASTVRTVIGQRLVRRINEEGKQSYQSEPAETDALQSVLGKLLPEKESAVATAAKDLGYESLPLRGQSAYTLFKGTDSPASPGGYKGRMGLYEVFPVSDTIKSLILKRATSSEIQKVAETEGMVSMREDGYLKALAGYTTLSEVNRVAAADNA